MTMPTPPTRRGATAIWICRDFTAVENSHSARVQARAMSPTNPHGSPLLPSGTNSPAPTRAMSTAATPIAAGRFRPLRDCRSGSSSAASSSRVSSASAAACSCWARVLARSASRRARRVSGASLSTAKSGGSNGLYLEELFLLGGEHGVNGVGGFLGHRVELVLGALDLVLTRLAVLRELVEVLFRAAAHRADGDPGVLRFRLREPHVLLAALLGEGGQHNSDHDAIVGGVHAEIGIPQRLLHRVH